MTKNPKAQLESLMRDEIAKAEARLFAHVGDRAEKTANQLVRQAWNDEVSEMAVEIVRERMEASGLRQRIVEKLAERLTVELIYDAITSLLADRSREGYRSYSFYRDVDRAVWETLHDGDGTPLPDGR
jgi:hypothetical protein